MRKVLVVLVILGTGSDGRLTCSKVMQEQRPEFHLVAPCSISGMSIIARTNTTSVKRCSQFANLKRGLAFNFKFPDKKRTTPENCLIYDCPESDALLSIRREKDFDYYSLYADPLPTDNAVCIVGVGMFRLHEERLNYTEAMTACRDEGGELASVLSFKRTNGLSDMVSDLKYGREAFVGLNDIESEGKFVTMSGKLASCYEYRSWGLGEPRNRRKQEDCVTIDGGRNWKVVDCSKRLPFLYQLLQEVGDYRNGFLAFVSSHGTAGIRFWWETTTELSMLKSQERKPLPLLTGREEVSKEWTCCPNGTRDRYLVGLWWDLKGKSFVVGCYRLGQMLNSEPDCQQLGRLKPAIDSD